MRLCINWLHVLINLQSALEAADRHDPSVMTIDEFTTVVEGLVSHIKDNTNLEKLIATLVEGQRVRVHEGGGGGGLCACEGRPVCLYACASGGFCVAVRLCAHPHAAAGGNAHSSARQHVAAYGNARQCTATRGGSRWRAAALPPCAGGRVHCPLGPH